MLLAAKQSVSLMEPQGWLWRALSCGRVRQCYHEKYDKELSQTLLLSLSFVAMRKLRGICQLVAIVGDNVTVLLSLIQYNFLIVVIDLLYIASVLRIIKDKKTIHLNKCKRWVDLFISFVSQIISNLIWTMLNLHLLSWHSRSKFELILCNIRWIVYLLNLNK